MFKEIENYYNGNKAYLLFLNGELTEKEEYKNFILDKNFQIAATLANLSSLLLITKEDIVENEGNLIYSSKVFDSYLLKSINIIGTSENNGIRIDNYLFPSKETAVATIRNKIAHGDFEIDFDNNLIVLNIQENKVKINVDKLASFVVSASQSILVHYKGTSYRRTIVGFKNKDKNRTKPFKNLSEIRNLIKSFSHIMFEIKSNDNSEIDEKCRELFECFLNVYKKYPEKMMTSPIYKELIKYLNDHNCVLNIKEERLKNKDSLEELEEFVKEAIFPKKFSYEEQVTLIGLEITKYFDKQNYKFNSALSCVKNLIMLDTIKKIKSVDHQKIGKSLLKNGFHNIVFTYNEMGLSIINMFESLYMYPFEILYRPTKEYKLKKEDLDFSLLDTSLFNVEILKINDNPLKEMKIRCDSCLKNVSKINDSVKECNKNLENVRKGGNKKVISLIEKQLEELNNQLKAIESIAESTKKEYDLMQNDYLNNSSFFRNEAIINGIRDSIAHGNYKIENYKEPTIIFEDLYEGEVAFKASITLAKFYTFIDENSKIIFDFIEKKEKAIK